MRSVMNMKKGMIHRLCEQQMRKMEMHTLPHNGLHDYLWTTFEK
jgi:hypothetical protein